MSWYGQGAIDSVIDKFFQEKGVSKGTFLDVGALDGMRFSNTYHLEKERGWSGICVEIHPSYIEILKENRPNSICYSCAAADVDQSEVEASLNFRGSMSTLDFDKESDFAIKYSGYYGDRKASEIGGFLNGRHKVNARTLNSIIEENIDKFPTINFVTVDIDGSEKRALPHLDLNKINPDMLCLEWGTVGEGHITNYAAKFNLVPARVIAADILFVRQEDVDLVRSIEPEAHNEITTPHPCD